MTKSEIESVREWLVREGYPLEYETARVAASVGYRAWQGQYYEDPQTKEHREIDLVAEEPDSARTPKYRPVLIIAECKNNSKPWLVLTTKVTTLEAGRGRDFLVSTVERRADLMPPEKPSPADFLLNVPERHGYSVIQAFSGPDTAYAALQGVTKAATQRLSRLRTHRQHAIAMPFIVVGGSLYQLGFADDGSEILDRIAWSRVLWRGSAAGGDRTIQVDVVTRDQLPTYLGLLREATRELARILANLPPEK